MNTTDILIIVVGALAVLALGAGLIARYRRSSAQELPWEKREQIEAEEPGSTTAIDDADALAIEEKTRPGLESAPADPDATTATEIEAPEPVGSRMERLRGRLASGGALGRTLLSILSRGDLSETDWEELEETLLVADVGLDATTELMDTLRTETKVRSTTDPEVVREILREELIKLVDPSMDRSLDVEPGTGDDGHKHPATILMVGVNGTGKTTTVGKLARLLVAEGKSVLLGAADTFRAAAADQLGTWGERVGVCSLGK